MDTQKKKKLNRLLDQVLFFFKKNCDCFNVFFFVRVFILMFGEGRRRRRRRNIAGTFSKKKISKKANKLPSVVSRGCRCLLVRVLLFICVGACKFVKRWSAACLQQAHVHTCWSTTKRLRLHFFSSSFKTGGREREREGVWSWSRTYKGTSFFSLNKNNKNKMNKKKNRFLLFVLFLAV